MSIDIKVEMNISDIEKLEGKLGVKVNKGNVTSIDDIDIEIKKVEIGSGFIENISVELIVSVGAGMVTNIVSSLIYDLAKSGAKKIKINDSPTRVREDEIEKIVRKKIESEKDEEI